MSSRRSQASLPGRPSALPGARPSLLAAAPPAARWLTGGAAAIVAVVLAAAALRGGDSLTALEVAAAAERGGAPRERRPASRPRDIAPAAELASATAGGVLALEALTARYPKDPAIFRALMLRHATPPPFHAAALAAAQRLLELDPDAAADREVQRVVSGAASGPPDAASTAFDLMAKQMGSHGLDMVYDLAAGSSALKERSLALLGNPAVLERATPAMRVAYELRVASSCKAREPLLPRAAEVGDQRALEVLTPLITAKPKGCGFLGIGRCPAPCAAVAEPIKQAIQAIQARTGVPPSGSSAPR